MDKVTVKDIWLDFSETSRVTSEQSKLNQKTVEKWVNLLKEQGLLIEKKTILKDYADKSGSCDKELVIQIPKKRDIYFYYTFWGTLSFGFIICIAINIVYNDDLSIFMNKFLKK